MNIFIGEIQKDFAFLNEEESFQLSKVLRKKVGDYIQVIDGKGNSVQGNIIAIHKKGADIKIQKKIEFSHTLNALHIAIAPTKSLDRLEFFIEKAVELGVSEVSLIDTFHSERKKLNVHKLIKKANQAAKQAQRATFITINDTIKLDDFIKKHNNAHIYIAHLDSHFSRIPLHKIHQIAHSIFLIGPEGDFSKQEIQNLLSFKNIESISLGNNRLRTETAALFLANWAYYNNIQ